MSGPLPELASLDTPRLRLVPVSPALARQVRAGDLSGIHAAPGWPHDDTADGLAISIRLGQPTGWLVLLDGAVIGDCGLHGAPDMDGRVEIGYGLAAPNRHLGYGTELVRAISDWLLTQPEIRTVEASTDPANRPSRRVLEKADFNRVGTRDDHALYERGRTRVK